MWQDNGLRCHFASGGFASSCIPLSPSSPFLSQEESREPHLHALSPQGVSVKQAEIKTLQTTGFSGFRWLKAWVYWGDCDERKGRRNERWIIPGRISEGSGFKVPLGRCEPRHPHSFDPPKPQCCQPPGGFGVSLTMFLKQDCEVPSPGNLDKMQIIIQ